MTDEEMDKLTRELMEPEAGDDPFCCIPTRHSIVNRIRKEFGLAELPATSEVANPVAKLFPGE